MGGNDIEFRAPADGGDLIGWRRPGPADTPPALLLHGGPGLSYYLDSLADELDGLFEIAGYQQRGLAPSIETGERNVERHVEDVVSVLDHLGWNRAIVIGHSWGGYLAMHFALGHPERLRGFVSIDPLCAIGDGGMAEFGAALEARADPAKRARLTELEALETPTETERAESMSIVWPGYFGDPGKAPPMPAFRFDTNSAEAWDSIKSHFDARTLELGLPHVVVPFLLIHGEASPLPIMQARRTVDVLRGARLAALPGVGHWPWLERPGSVRAEMERFLASL
jgi:pimeloyl-ACP methyl ester carboxylesterase